MRYITIPIAPSEFLDKITVLEIKLDKITDPEKVKNIKKEYDILMDFRKENIPNSAEVDNLYKELKNANLTIWDGLDEWFEFRRTGKVDESLAKILNSVQVANNEKRFPVKRKIDELLESSIVEEKSYLFDD